MGYLEILWIINSTFAKGGISLLPLCPVCKALVMRIIKELGQAYVGEGDLLANLFGGRDGKHKK